MNTPDYNQTPDKNLFYLFLIAVVNLFLPVFYTRVDTLLGKIVETGNTFLLTVIPIISTLIVFVYLISSYIRSHRVKIISDVSIKNIPVHTLAFVSGKPITERILLARMIELIKVGYISLSNVYPLRTELTEDIELKLIVDPSVITSQFDKALLSYYWHGQIFKGAKTRVSFFHTFSEKLHMYQETQGVSIMKLHNFSQHEAYDLKLYTTNMNRNRFNIILGILFFVISYFFVIINSDVDWGTVLTLYVYMTSISGTLLVLFGFFSNSTPKTSLGVHVYKKIHILLKKIKNGENIENDVNDLNVFKIFSGMLSPYSILSIKGDIEMYKKFLDTKEGKLFINQYYFEQAKSF